MPLIDRVFKRFGLKKQVTDEKPVVKRYRPNQARQRSAEYRERLPVFTLDTIRQMMRDPKVSMAFSVATDPMRVAEFECTGDTDEINGYVLEQMHSIWSSGFDQLVQTFEVGWSGHEVMYRIANSGPDRGKLVFDNLRDFDPGDVKPISIDTEKIGMQIAGAVVRGRRNQFQGKPALWGMKKLYVAHRARHGSNYGRSILRPAYGPWCEKHHANGAIALRRLRFFKDAYIGDVIKYPMGMKIPQADGSFISADDLAREMIEERASGAVMAMPSQKDAAGNDLFEYNPPQHIPGGEDMLEYIRQLDREIFDGFNVPAEVIEASETGSGYSGRSIPFLVFLMQREAMAEELVKQINEQIIKALVEWNYGVSQPDYTLTVKPLIDTIGAQMGEGGMDSQLAGPAQQVGNPAILPMDTVQMSSLYEDLADEGRKSIDDGARVARGFQRHIMKAGAKKKQVEGSTAPSSERSVS